MLLGCTIILTMTALIQGATTPIDTFKCSPTKTYALGDAYYPVPSTNTGAVGTIDGTAVNCWNSQCANLEMIPGAIAIPDCDATVKFTAHLLGVNMTLSITGLQVPVLTTGDHTITIPNNLFGCGNASGTTAPLNYMIVVSTASGTCTDPNAQYFTYTFHAEGNVNASPFLRAASCPNGCTACSDPNTCTDCELRSYRVGTPDPTTHLCPCLQGFYEDPTTNLCVKCPLNQYCKGCAYDNTSSSVKCTSCYCGQHRSFDATTGTCPCDSTHTQDSANAYCILQTGP